MITMYYMREDSICNEIKIKKTPWLVEKELLEVSLPLKLQVDTTEVK